MDNLESRVFFKARVIFSLCPFVVFLGNILTPTFLRVLHEHLAQQLSSLMCKDMCVCNWVAVMDHVKPISDDSSGEID